MFSSTLRLCSNQVKSQVTKNIQQFINKSSKTSGLNIEALMQREHNTKYKTKDSQLFKFNGHQRYLSTQTIIKSSSTIFDSGENNQDYKIVFPEIVRDITEDSRYQDIPDVNRWLLKVLEYNLPAGKKNRMAQLITAYKILEKPENVTQENMKLAYILGWCVELLQGLLIISDDIIDNSKTRRGKPCWHKLENVGLSGFNDAIILENSVYTILKKYFHKHPNYIPMMELFHETALRTAMGQCLDTHTHHNGRPNLDVYTMEKFNSLAKYKTGYYTFHIPVALAMYLAGISDPVLHKEAEDIQLKIGHFYQVENDILDCYGDPKNTGKEGTDIQEGKCTWLAVMTLQKATPKQRDIFKKCYGRDDQKSVDTIKDIYQQLNLQASYATHKENSYNLLKDQIQQMSGSLPNELFFKIFQMVYDKHKSTN